MWVPIILFIAYISISLILFGVPQSLSGTHYLWKNRFKYGSVIFPMFLVTFCGFLLPDILNLTEGSNFQFLGFLMIASLIFVAFSPLFLEPGDKGVHMTAAIVSAISGMSFCLVFGYWAVLLWSVLIFGLLSIKYKEHIIFLMEMCTFLSVLINLIII